MGLEFRVWGLEFGVWGLGFGVWGLGFGVWGLGFGVWGLGFGVSGFGARGSGLVIRDEGLGLHAGAVLGLGFRGPSFGFRHIGFQHLCVWRLAFPVKHAQSNRPGGNPGANRWCL